MKRYAIVTCCDINYSQFLVQHWYRSLKENVNLKATDICILDYGLDDSARLNMPDAKFYLSNKDGHIVNLRYRDLIKVLDEGYEQVLLCDGGDIIFQSDISQLFELNPESIRGVVEYDVPYDSLFLYKFNKEYQADIEETVKGRGLINGGFVLAENNLFKEVCKEYLEIVRDLKSFGPDQLGVTYLSYKKGFVEIDRGFNFVINAFVEDKFTIRKGVFYFSSGNIIPVVHNAGRYKAFRPIKNFGFGKDRNQVGLAHHLMPIVLKIARKVIQ
jgi:hypothetical protein